MANRVLLCDPTSVREEHGRMFRALTRQLGIHRDSLNAQGWFVLTRAAFSLYLDSLAEQLPLFSDDQFPKELEQPHPDAPTTLATPPISKVRQRTP